MNIKCYGNNFINNLNFPLLWNLYGFGRLEFQKAAIN
jgi:hypothetical protein